jgi:hypothetical protein
VPAKPNCSEDNQKEKRLTRLPDLAAELEAIAQAVRRLRPVHCDAYYELRSEILGRLRALAHRCPEPPPPRRIVVERVRVEVREVRMPGRLLRRRHRFPKPPPGQARLLL